MVEEKISFKRTLTTKDLLVYGIIFMIPVAPLAFYGSFLVPANGMVALAYLVGGIAMLLLDLVTRQWLKDILTQVPFITMSSEGLIPIWDLLPDGELHLIIY